MGASSPVERRLEFAALAVALSIVVLIVALAVAVALSKYEVLIVVLLSVFGHLGTHH